MVMCAVSCSEAEEEQIAIAEVEVREEVLAQSAAYWEGGHYWGKKSSDLLRADERAVIR